MKRDCSTRGEMSCAAPSAGAEIGHTQRMRSMRGGFGGEDAGCGHVHRAVDIELERLAFEYGIAERGVDMIIQPPVTAGARFFGSVGAFVAPIHVAFVRLTL